MKQVILYALLFACSLTISSCKKSDSGRGGGTCSWELTFDTPPAFSWSGTLPATGSNDGQAIYTGNSGTNTNVAMTMSSPTNGGVRDQTIGVELSSVRTGNFTMNEFSYDQNTLVGNVITIIFNSTTVYSSQFPGSNITFNISQLDQNSVATSGYSGAGYVSGSFSGNICDISGNSHVVSGTFNCIRLQ